MLNFQKRIHFPKPTSASAKFYHIFDICSTTFRQYLQQNFLLLDVPYIGSEHTCAVTGYKYQPFHKKVADYLQNAEDPFIYYCRSTPPKSGKTSTRADAEHIMKMKLGQYFMNKGYYFQKVHLNEYTELMVSNRQYDANTQFQWTSFEYNII